MLFFSLATIDMGNVLYHPEDNMQNSPTIGYSWIRYHFEQRGIYVILNFVALGLFIYGGLDDLRKSKWKLSDHVKIEVIEEGDSS